MYTATNLNVNTRYQWTVRPRINNQYGTTLGGPIAFTTLQADPSTSLPSVFYQNVSNINDTTAFFAWTSSNPNNRTINYQVCYSKDRHTVFASCYDPTTATSLSVSGLEPGTEYFYTYLLDDGVYQVFPTEALRSFITTGVKPVTGPYAYATSTANIGPTSATITWQSGNPGVSFINDYCVSKDVLKVNRNCTSTANTQAVLNNLDSNSDYFWNVRVRDNIHGNRYAFDGPLKFTTNLSTTNVNPSVSLTDPAQDTVVSNSQVDLKWNGSDGNNDTLQYKLYVKSVSTSDTTTYTNSDIIQSGFERTLLDPTASLYVLTNLSANTKYWWTVTVNDNRGGGNIIAANGPFRFTTSSTLTNNGILSGFVVATTSSTGTVGVSDFTTGTNVFVNFVVTNNTNIAQTLNFNSNKLSIFTFKQLPSGNIVRLSTDGRTYNNTFQSITIPANSSQVIDSFLWDGSTYTSNARVYGSFEVSAQILTTNVTFNSNPFVFLLRDTTSAASTVTYVNNGSGGGYYPGTSSNNDIVTALRMPATERDQNIEWFGPVSFEDSNGVATVNLKHTSQYSAGQFIGIVMDKGTIITNRNGTRFVGTYQAPRKVELNKLAEPMRSKLPNATELSIFGMQYGNLNEKYSKPVVMQGTFSDDPRNLVAAPADFAIMAWDFETETWKKVGGVENFTGKNFQVSTDKSTIIGFFNMKGKGFTGTTPVSPVVSDTCRGIMPTPFIDANNHWASYYICRLYRTGAVTGYVGGPFNGTFQPDRSVSRAELLKTIMEVQHVTPDTSLTTNYKDVDRNDWYAGYVAKAHQLGIIKGYNDGTFRPNAEVNRAEALKMILLTNPAILDSMIQNEKIAEAMDADNFAGFTDVLESQWYAPFVTFAKKRGIIGGKADGLFHPSDKMSRAEMTKVILLSSELTI